ncbi:MAG: hypothetical protein R3Y23_00460 [Bacillota bacterium]
MFNSKRKKIEKQMAIEAEMQARINNEAALVEANSPKQPRASVRLMHNCGPVPIAPPSDFIQLTPIVQPIPLVPYSTQSQPLVMFDEFED